MSRIGKKPVAVPAGVTANIEGRQLSVKGPKGTLSMQLADEVSYEIGDGTSDLRPDSALASVESLEVDGRLHSSWREAVEREVAAPALSIDGLVVDHPPRPIG